MSKSWKTLVAAVVAAGGASSVAIADGYEPVGKGFAPPRVGCCCATAYKWSGVYAGANLGYADHTAKWTDIDFDWHGSTLEFTEGDWTVGGTLGFNYQKCNTVFGIEADWNWSNIDSFDRYNDDNRVAVRNELKWFGTVRGRAGLAMDSTLMFVTGGLAYAKTDRSWIEDLDPTDSWPSLGDTKWGWVVGGGIEHGMSNAVSFKAEALYMQFDENSSTNQDGFQYQIEDEVVVIRTGLNFKFGGAY